MIVEQRSDAPSDQFPVGMRVLAVDDDPICLRLLETLLRKCQYHVTTTSQAITALKMLRENKNKFDLVISDVHMPDMDGFKLLELVGLEMDLPVIMLSANGDTQLVMKGITHGACDYLLKPIRLEELKNIWQHVIRRKKFESRDRSSSNSKDNNTLEANGTGTVNSDQDAKFSKKRKDQYGDDEEEQDENEHENEDPSAQKRPRVVWSVELHRKFVAAVNELGLDKAVPKKILDLMNVDKLTRENVASHLQKYRLYLKRISSVANQQANMVAALGGPDSPYLHMNSVNFHNLHGSPLFQNNALRSISTAGALGRFNTPSGLGLHGLSPSGMVQLGHAQIPMSLVNDCTKFQPGSLPGDQTSTVLQGVPTSLEFDHLQQKDDHSGNFPISNDFSEAKSNVIGGSSNPFLNLPSCSFTIQGHLHNRQVDSRCNDSWPTAVQSAPTHANPMANMVDDFSPNLSVQPVVQQSRFDTHHQAALTSDDMAQNKSYAPKQAWDDHKLDVLSHAGFLDASVDSPMAAHRNSGFDPMGQPGFDSLSTQQNQLVEGFGVDMAIKLKQGQFTEQGRPFGSYAGNGAGSLEDVVTSLFYRV